MASSAPTTKDLRYRNEAPLAAMDDSLAEIYEQHFDFVWRNVRRMGVPAFAAEDVVQDVFLVAHRRLGDFERRSSVTTWLFGILLRVVKDHRRSHARHNARLEGVKSEPVEPSLSDQSPLDDLARRRAVETLYELLEQLDTEKREVFAMVELEQIPLVQAARTLELNVNTAQARLRAARMQFELALASHRSRPGVEESQGDHYAQRT